MKYKLINWEITQLHNEYDLGVGFDDKFKAGKYILSILLRPNKMIDWMLRNVYFRG